ncbi:MAG: ABC transporter ATP-binding protein [Bacteroides sp.]|nr:ABC transporter ATP-binding protein/permease [Bacteroides sp.]MDD6150615.1 ABC transporter ATP-binding protein [Bacteroides sp.]MDY2972607.1 ABC transporter ATP-binding protein [Candidatus Cryptobacteroides sp.]MED9899573.1 ABC transporter ATP-binding protein [Bacteroidales bacterium]HAW06520.1 antibiotic ABC transporter ATP-binding protein [Rikenellaceae bacterium]
MKEFWQVLVKYVKPYRGYLGGSIVLNMLSAVLNIFSFSLIIPILQILFKMSNTVYSFIPWDSADMGFKDIVINNAYYGVTVLIQDKGAAMTLFLLCLWLSITTLMKTACYFGSSAIMIPIRTSVVRDMRRELYNKILTLPLGFFSQERKGDIIARMSGDINEVESSIMSTLDMLLKNPILIIFYMGTLIITSWQLTVFTIVVAPLLIWLMSALGRTLKKKSLQAQALWSDTMSQLEETLGGLRVIKAFVAEDKMQTRFNNVTEAVKKKTGRVATRQALAHPMSEFLGTVLIAIVLGFGGAIILSEKAWFDAPTFIFYMVILYSVINPLKDFAKAGYNIPKGMASMERVNKILETESSIKEAPNASDVTGFNDEITFSNVSFSYDEDRKILDDINLTVKKGTTVAIVGESGAGKSTLVDLIPRFYDVTGGSIKIDGTDIRDMKIHSLRSLMGNVNQEPILFNDTIFNNIAFGVEGATMEQVIAAAKIANAHDFIMEKEDGYNTNIGDRGMRLSGGQRQRLSIARAILKNPPILILDEATASLDTESEKLVQEALDRLMSTRTTIAIAHRLSTIKNSDEIIVMHEGHIVERGKHEELLALNGYYKKLTDMQSL